jgi:hypothetical protein
VKHSEAVWALDVVQVDLSKLHNSKRCPQLHLKQQQQGLQQQQQQQQPAHTGGIACQGPSRGAACGASSLPATETAAASSSSSSNAGQHCAFVELMVLLPKDDGGHYWRALFEGGEEKSHLEVGEGVINKRRKSTVRLKERCRSDF